MKHHRSLGFALLCFATFGGAATTLAIPGRNTPARSVQSPPTPYPPAAQASGSKPVVKVIASGKTENMASTPSLSLPPQGKLAVASRAAPSAVVISQDPRPTLTPTTFIDTMRAAWNYKRIDEAGGWPSLPSDTVLKAGDKGPMVATLRKRLALEGDLGRDKDVGETFDAELVAAVKRFQFRHGLSASGAVRAKTIEALNVPAKARHRQLVASAQRLMGSNFPFGERYVVVNIPSATVEAVQNGQVARRYVAIAGKVERPSPRIETRITAVNLNPTWTVPASLIKKDIIPHVRNDPTYLTKMKIRILDAKGQEVDPHALDWSKETAVNYTLRQDSGADNSLGQIRIDMPNKEAVYMHDTPSKRLFAQDTRFHSSGCIRIADVTSFSEWLLAGVPGPSGEWTRPNIEAAIATAARQDIKLERPVPVAWVYLTGYATQDGTSHFRRDVYSLDEPKLAPAPNAPELDVPTTSSVAPKRP